MLQDMGIKNPSESDTKWATTVYSDIQRRSKTPEEALEREKEIAKAFKDMSELAVVLKDDEKALLAWKKGFVAEDFKKPEYEGLPIDWVWNLLDIDNKSIYTRVMPHY